jgi:GNAT superfamily N-acetyltransferase
VDLLVTNLAQRPDLAPQLDRFAGAWPEFMYHDPLATLVYGHADTALAEFCLVAVSRDDPGLAVAKAYSTPFRWPAGALDELPDGGWDAAALSAADDRLAGRRGNLVCALEVTVRPELRGRGLSRVMLDALRRNASALGFRDLVVPVRPNGKHALAELPMAEYVRMTRDDGLPVDPWLRTHVRAGGRVVRVAPRSMTIVGSLSDWREWTGLPFDATGPVRVPQALVPVHCDVASDLAVYVEPNVWVHHTL